MISDDTLQRECLLGVYCVLRARPSCLSKVATSNGPPGPPREAPRATGADRRLLPERTPQAPQPARDEDSLYGHRESGGSPESMGMGRGGLSGGGRSRPTPTSSSKRSVGEKHSVARSVGLRRLGRRSLAAAARMAAPWCRPRLRLGRRLRLERRLRLGRRRRSGPRGRRRERGRRRSAGLQEVVVRPPSLAASAAATSAVAAAAAQPSAPAAAAGSAARSSTAACSPARTSRTAAASLCSAPRATRMAASAPARAAIGAPSPSCPYCGPNTAARQASNTRSPARSAAPALEQSLQPQPRLSLVHCVAARCRLVEGLAKDCTRLVGPESSDCRQPIAGRGVCGLEDPPAWLGAQRVQRRQQPGQPEQTRRGAPQVRRSRGWCGRRVCGAA
jgi:hypothetical protein